MVHNLDLTQVHKQLTASSCHNRANNEVESPQQGADSGCQTGRKAFQKAHHTVDEQIGNQIQNDNQCGLHTELIHRLSNGDFIFHLEGVHGNGTGDIVLVAGTQQLTLAAEDVHINNAYQTSAQIACSSQRQTEAATAQHTQCFIGRADIVCLAGALTVCHGQQNTACLKQVGHNGVSQCQRNHQTNQRLHQIGADDEGTVLCTQILAFPFHFLGHTQCQRNEAKGNGMVGDRFQEHTVDDFKADGAENQHQEACQHSGGHQAVSDQCNFSTQHVGCQNQHGDNAQLNHRCPKGSICRGKIHTYYLTVSLRFRFCFTQP